MAEDLLSLLQTSYNKYTNDNLKNTNDKLASQYDLNTNSDGSIYGLGKLYKKEANEIAKTLEKLKEEESKRYKAIFKKELELHEYSTRLKNDALKHEIDAHNKMYTVKLNNEKTLNSILERQAKTYKEIADSGKVNLGHLAEIYIQEQEIAKLEKSTIEYKKEQFAKGVENVKKGISTVVEHFFKRLNEYSDLMLWNNLKTGIEQLGTTYEERFSEIAGRSGSDSRLDTHAIISSTLSNLVNDSTLNSALNFNNEVFPAITDAIKQGFQGNEATSIAIGNAIDKKITPWLDTQSETWVNLQYSLSDNMLAQLKGQQLQLQATQEGNRILQNGVVSTLLDELSPTLLNIDANTTDVSALSGQAQMMVASLMDNGYSKQDAIKVANQTIDAYQNPFKNLSGNSTSWQKLLAMGGLQGGDLASAMEFATNAISPFNNGTWQAGGAVEMMLGVPSNGFTRNTDYMSDLIKGAQAASNYIGSGLADTYYNKTNNLNEYITATQQNDNKYQNSIANQVMDSNLTAHGIQIQGMILDEVHQLKTWLYTTMGALLGGIIADKVTNGFIKNVLTKFKGGETSSTDGGILKNLTSPGAGNSKITQALNSKLSGAALVTGGLIVANKGIQAGINDYKKYNDGSSTDYEKETVNSLGNKALIGTAIAGGATAAVAGGLTMAGVAAGPIGWVALAVGGLALAGKAAYDYAHRLSGLAEQYEAHGEELKTAFTQEQQQRVENLAFLKRDIKNAADEKEAQNEIIKSGLLSEQTARNMTADELTTLTTDIIKTQNAITALGEASIDAKTKIAKEEAQNQTNDVINKTYDNIKNLLGSDNVVKKGEENYSAIKSMFEGMASSITDDEERKLMQEQLKTMFADNEFDVEELKVLMNKGGNGRAFWHTTIDRKRNFYDYAMDVEKANAYLGLIDDNGSYDLTNVNMDQDTAGWQTALDKWYSKYKDAKDDKSKEAYKRQFLNVWNTNIKPNSEYYEYLKPKYQSAALAMGIKEFKIGSSYIPYDMLAMVHTGERVLTEGQNKKYTEELVSGNSSSSIIQAGVQDIVVAIKTQTSEIINYLSTIKIGGSAFGNSHLNMLPSMGNTKVTL